MNREDYVKTRDRIKEIFRDASGVVEFGQIMDRVERECTPAQKSAISRMMKHMTGTFLRDDAFRAFAENKLSQNPKEAAS